MDRTYSSAYPRQASQLPLPVRPPIHNPYDKFTQPQFDEWIGGITSALRKALGQEEEETLTSQPTEPPRGKDMHPVSDTDEDNVEDSLAEWKAIRAKEKGKMRATEDEQDSEYGSSQESYEGPGVQVYPGGVTQGGPIELVSDDDNSEKGESNNHAEHDGRSIEDFGPVRLSVGSSQPAVSKFHTNPSGQEAIDISDGESENHYQVDDLFEEEDELFGWEQDEQGEYQQSPDPWDLPRTYADDLYVGGPGREMNRPELSTSLLTSPADNLDDIDPRLRSPPFLKSQPADHNFAEDSQGPATRKLLSPTEDQESSSDDEISLYDEDVPELNTTATVTLRDESDFVSFTALNQPSDVESEQGGPEILYISDNDGGEVSEEDKGVEEDVFDGPIPLGTSDLEIPAECGVEEDRGEEFDELEDDDEPSYGYYGLDVSSLPGSGGLEEETKPIGPPSDAPKGDLSVSSNAITSQEESALLPDLHNPAPLPAAATFIDIDPQPHSKVSVTVDEAKNVSPVGGAPIISDEAGVSIGEPHYADDDSAGDNTILGDGAVLTENEIEEVLGDAFAEANQLVPSLSARGCTALVGDSPEEEQVARVSPRPNTTHEVFVGDEPPIEKSAVGTEDSCFGSPPPTVRDEASNFQEAQNKSLPFVMPLIANPNVRDPMSAPWSPAPSGPPTPVTSLAYLPGVTKFKRDNQLSGVTHGSGLFTPLEGSGSSSPSPSGTMTPEDPVVAEVETVVDDDQRYQVEERITSAVVSPTNGSSNLYGVEADVVPLGSPQGDDWEEVPRLSVPPAETLDHLEGTLAAIPATRVFFQPESGENVEGLDAQSGAGRDDDIRSSDVLPVTAADTPPKEEQHQGARELDKQEPLVRPTDDPFKLMEHNRVIAPDTAPSDHEVSSSPGEEQTPRSKPPEVPVPVIEDLPAAGLIHHEAQRTSPLSTHTRGNSVIPGKIRENPRKRKRLAAIPTQKKPSEPEPATNDKTVNEAFTKEEYEEVSHELTGEERQNKEEEHHSDNGSSTSNVVAPRNDDPSGQDGSRASSIASEQSPLVQRRPLVPEDAPVFHGHGKFKATLQALKLRQASGNRAQKPEQETESLKEKEKEKDPPVVAKVGSRKTSENPSGNRAETEKPPSLILPVVSTQPSQSSPSASQSPVTPVSTLPPSSPTVLMAPEKDTPPQQEGHPLQESTERNQEPTKRLTTKAKKRTATRKHAVFEPKSTRSQCRYHKISLPREEDGPRVTFCVPQCSLNDKELMENEEITDDGLATVRDFERLWDHVEEQNLNPYLIGIIRQLVGVDLLRENEIYYLPTDEEVEQMEEIRSRKERRKSKKFTGGAADTENTSITGLVSAFGPTLGRVEKDTSISFAGSISTASTRSKAEEGGPVRPISEAELSDGDRGRRTKRRRTRKEQDKGSSRNTPSVREDSATPSIASSSAPSQSMTERTPVSRPRRALKKAASSDARAYKPAGSSSESDEGELEDTKRKRKPVRGGTKGIKRRRTDGVDDSSVPGPSVAGDDDVPLSPRSTRSKRAKIDEK